MAQEPNINVLLYAQTDIGMVRHGNEDNFLVVDLSTAETWTVENSAAPPKRLLSFSQGHYGSLIAVSDGMGGALAGEVASQMAVSAVRDRMLQFQATPSFSQFAFHERLRLAIEQANLLINAESQNNVEYTGMGATFTAAGLDGDIAYLAQVGDSRCYLVRSGKIAQVTKDQSLVSQLVEAGHITEEEAEQHTYKNVILQALGAQPRVNVIVDRVKLRKNDTLLLCSDGLSGKVKGPEMLKILMETPGDIKNACDALIKLANERGGEDNITVLIARFDGEGLADVASDDPSKGEFIPRDPQLPDEVDPSSLSIAVPDDETLRPEEHPAVASNSKAERERERERERESKRVDVVETQEVQATMLNIPAVTPQMLAAHAQMSQSEATPSAPAASVSTSTPEPVATSAPAAPITPPAATDNQPRMAAATSNNNNSSASMAADAATDAPSSSGGKALIVIIVLAALAAIGYFVWNNLRPQPPSPSPAPVNSSQPSVAPTNSSPAPVATPASTEPLLGADELFQKVKAKLEGLQHKAALLPNGPRRDLNTQLDPISREFEGLKALNSSGTINQEDLNKRCNALIAQLNEIDEKLKGTTGGGKPEAPKTDQKPAEGTGNN